MTIGVFGDSYAHAKYPDKAVCWFNLLADKLNQKCITYGQPGASLYYSYKQFTNLYHKFNLNIFLATSPGRYTKQLTLTKDKQTRYVTSIPHIEQLKLNPALTDADRSILEGMKSWFTFQDSDYENDMVELMLDKVDTFKDTIVIPCFSISFHQERFDKYGLDIDLHPLHTMWLRQLELLDIDPNGFVCNEKDVICGHLGPEWNRFLADLLYNRITTGKWDYSGFYDVKMEYPANYYYNL
jgi:hypothetical protein